MPLSAASILRITSAVTAARGTTVQYEREEQDFALQHRLDGDPAIDLADLETYRALFRRLRIPAPPAAREFAPIGGRLWLS